jgi:hypothetical protein
MALQENNPAIDPVSSKSVLEMLTVANDYCLFMEKAEDYTRDEILSYAQKVLPLVYIKCTLLPVVETGDDDITEHFVTEEQWELLFNTLRIKLENDDIYYFIDLYETNNQDPVRASLSENLSDIYQDMKDFVLLYQKPLRSAKLNAVNDCRSLFETRTGTTLVNALKAIHHLAYRKMKDNDPIEFF